MGLRLFVRWFLLVFIAVIVLNLSALVFGIYQMWMYYVFFTFVGVFVFLVFRRKGWIGNAIAYGVPLLILLYVLYWNILPFGFERDIVLDVGTPGDTDASNEFYIVDNDDLGPMEMFDGKTFRRLNGKTEAVFNTKAVLKNATVEVSIEGEDVYLFAPKPFNPTEYTWDYIFNFERGIPAMLKGNATWKEGCGAYFDGTTSLFLPDSADMFEDGPFSVYVEWTPMKDNESAQQIIGHYNWELWQDENQLEFFVGRMNNASGPFYTLHYPLNAGLLNVKHSALAVYNPSEYGYIELYVDNQYAGREFIGNDTLFKSYGNEDISYGKSTHGLAIYFNGCLHRNMITYSAVNVFTKSGTFDIDANDPSFHLIGIGELDSIRLQII